MQILRPPPNLTVTEWASRNLYLSPEDSAEPGLYRPSRAPYQQGIMDAVHEAGVHTVVVMSSAQIGKTCIIKSIIGYHIDQDPAPILLVNPSIEMAETFSKDRLAPMVRDSPCLRGRIADPKSRDSGNTILSKHFAGGHLTMIGANAPAGLASRPIRVVLCDEVDRYPASAGTEGDPVNLAVKRTATFHNRRIVLTSTPTIKGASRIEAAYLESDRRRYLVPCPHCGERQPLVWSNLSWPPDEPERAVYACAHCGAAIEERQRPALLRAGEWVGEAPCRGIAGFHLNELYSPWRRWSDIVRDFLSAKRSPETLKTWVNTSLGETWEEEAEKSDPISLLSRRENYTPAALPSDILYLTVGVDVQDNRLEAELVGWRQLDREAPPESWGIEYRVFQGDPAQTAVWQDLDAWLLDDWRTADGRALRVGAACIDSGGHHTAQVYAFCAARRGRHVYAIKGIDGARPIWKPRASKSKKYQAEVWQLGSDTAKDTWYARLRIADPGPGYCHFPVGYDAAYFAGLTAEQVRTRYKKGHPVREWYNPPGRRNEPLDIRCMALAALLARPVPWAQLAAQPGVPRAAAAPTAAPRAPNSFIRRPAGTPWLRRH
jgi:phage terminase large subunit GpA-like protein